MYNVSRRVVVVSAVVCISLKRLLSIRVQRTWVYLTVSQKKCPLVSFLYYNWIATQAHKETQSQSEVSLKQQSSCTGSHTITCSKLAQLTLRKKHSYANSQTHSMAGSQAYRRLEWCDREVGVRVEVRFGVKVGDTVWSPMWNPMWSELLGEATPDHTLENKIKLCFYLAFGTQITAVKFS